MKFGTGEEEIQRALKPANLKLICKANADQKEQRHSNPWPCPCLCGFSVTWHESHCCPVCRDTEGMKHGHRCHKLKATAMPPSREDNAKCPEGHVLAFWGSTGDKPWSCRGAYTLGGCTHGGGYAGQTKGVARFRCKQCNYDLCSSCHDKQLARSQAVSVQAFTPHSLNRQPTTVSGQAFTTSTPTAAGTQERRQSFSAPSERSCSPRPDVQEPDTMQPSSVQGRTPQNRPPQKTTLRDSFRSTSPVPDQKRPRAYLFSQTSPSKLPGPVRGLQRQTSHFRLDGLQPRRRRETLFITTRIILETCFQSPTTK